MDLCRFKFKTQNYDNSSIMYDLFAGAGGLLVDANKKNASS